MARHKKGERIHGWLVLDKPAGMTSAQAVARVRWLLNAQKAGHAGTLDPLATGILPIALGEATKTVSFAVDGEKAYRFTVRWGAETPTDDAESAPVRVSDRRPAEADILGLLPRFTGEIWQVPPQFSAIKVEGHRAYDLARDGEDLDLAPRQVVIRSLACIGRPDDATAEFEAACGKGTYIRALARDMGRELRCFGHLVALRRMRVGPFAADGAITLPELEAACERGEAGHCLRPVEAALSHLAQIQTSPADAARLARGQSMILRGRDAPVVRGAAYAVFAGRLVALGEIERAEFRPTRVFNWG